MDTMRSLNNTLPPTTPSRRQRSKQPPPEHLLASFKQAALSVTNLYKAAAGEADKAYSEGYQHALEDLLGFLDRENLGLQDGEGWRVRQFVTERWEGGGGDREGGESDEEREEERRASSPEGKRKGSPEPVSIARSSSSISQGRAESAPPVASATEPTIAQRSTNTPVSPQIQSYTVPSGDFTFQSSHQYPRDMETDDNGTVHINVVPHAPHRPSRSGNRSQNMERRQQQLARNSSTLGHGAGMKRRVGTAFDFFDLGGFSGKDPFGGSGAGGGGKRGRFT